MLFDASDLPDGQPLTADLCIVGAGAAGITLALQFAGTDVDVLLLESGGFKPEADTQALYAGKVRDERLHIPPDRYRARRFGGSTSLWGGRSCPFDPIDFKTREYVPHSGWPLAYEDLLPFYPAANRLIEAGEFAYREPEVLGDAAQHNPPIISGFNSEHFSQDALERFSCPTNFGERYRHKLVAAGNITALLHANVMSINLRPAGDRVDSVTVGTLTGKRFRVTAKHFVTAVGGLETPRLLLASRDVQAQGIGNSHDVVGRYYMCHIAGTIGALTIDRPQADVNYGYRVDEEGIYCRRRFALRESVQSRLGLMNFIARLHHPRIADPAHRNGVLSLLYLAKPLIPYEYAVRLHGDEGADLRTWLRHLRNVGTAPTDAVAFAWHMLRDRKLSDRKFPSIILRSRANLFSLDFHSEQEPDPLSRVMLDEARDALGMPRLLIDWRYSSGDLRTVHRSLELLAQDLRTSGVGRFEYDPASVEEEMIRYGAYGGHHIGTARMGSDPRSSVVDSQGRVHGIGNLFVAGSAIFPTSSQANPTLTIVALALRLSRHLAALLHAPSPALASQLDGADARNEP
jgi:choline dehydrogenase-like flavoprotein